MLNLNFGTGQVGVKPKITSTTTSVTLGILNQEYEIGSSFSEEDFQPIIELFFETEDGLDVLINALECCKASFVEIPDELRMGA